MKKKEIASRVLVSISLTLFIMLLFNCSAFNAGLKSSEEIIRYFFIYFIGTTLCLGANHFIRNSIDKGKTGVVEQTEKGAGD